MQAFEGVAEGFVAGIDFETLTKYLQGLLLLTRLPKNFAQVRRNFSVWPVFEGAAQ